jgi:hypothetical protein
MASKFHGKSIPLCLSQGERLGHDCHHAIAVARQHKKQA